MTPHDHDWERCSSCDNGDLVCADCREHYSVELTFRLRLWWWLGCIGVRLRVMPLWRFAIRRFWDGLP